MVSDWMLRALFMVGLFSLGWLCYRLVINRLLAGAKSGQPTLQEWKAGVAGILYFTTPGCSTCKSVQRPALARLKEMAQIDFQVVEINAVEQPELAKEWGVLSVPMTFILNSSGVAQDVNIGAASAEKLASQLQNIST